MSKIGLYESDRHFSVSTGTTLLMDGPICDPLDLFCEKRDNKETEKERLVPDGS